MLENKVIVIIVIFVFSILRMKAYPKQEQKITPESILPPLGKTQSTIYGATSYRKLLSVSSLFPFKIQSYMKEGNKWGAFK